MSTWNLIEKLLMVLGGLGLFMYGMQLMSGALENIAGDRMRIVLERATSNRFLGFLVGTAVTCVIQSSSATTVMVVGFVNARLMTLAQGIGVIMGANVGTTITAQIISLRIDPIAPLFIFIGAVLYMFFKKRNVKNLGLCLLGFGTLFYGISVMGSPLKEIANLPGFIAMLTAFDNPFLALLAGLVFTGVIQSSSASTGIIVALYLGGVDLPFKTAAYLVLGCAIGTCVTALLASLAANREAKRAALVHVLVNIFGCVIFGSLIAVFPRILEWFQDTWSDGARQIAMFHTLFKVANTIMFIPFVKQLVTFVHWILPELPDENANNKRLIYLDPKIILTPAIAVTQAQRELSRMGKIVLENLALALESFFTHNMEKAAMVLEVEDTINFLNHKITAALVHIRALDLPTSELEKLGMMLHTVSDIERLGDHAENIAEYTRPEGDPNANISTTAMEELRTLSEASMDVVKLALEIFETRDESRLIFVDPLEEKVDKLTEIYLENHIKRLMNEICEPRGGVIFADMLIDLERCADHATNIAYSILGETVWDPRRHQLLKVAE